MTDEYVVRSQKMTRAEFIQYWANLLTEAGLFGVLPEPVNFNVDEERTTVLDFGSGPVAGRRLSFRCQVGDNWLKWSTEITAAMDEGSAIDPDKLTAAACVERLRAYRQRGGGA